MMAHCGTEKVITGVKNTYWFSYMRRKIQTYINNCIICLMANASAHARGELEKVRTLPFEIMHVNHFYQKQRMVINISW